MKKTLSFVAIAAVSVPAWAQEVPEPSALALFVAGGLAIFAASKFRKK